MDEVTTADVRATEHALRAAGLALSADEIARIASSHGGLRAKADAFSALDLRDIEPVDPGATARSAALPGEDGRP